MKLILFFLTVQENNKGLQNLIPAYYTLIAAGIGAIIALVTQFLSSYLTSYRERKKLKMELVAEERSLAYLISQYYGVFIGEVVASQLHLRMAAIAFEENNKVDNSIFYKSANEALDRAQELDEKIRITNSKYLKVITHFTNLTEDRKTIISLFESLKSFEKPNFNFNQCKNMNELNNAREKETNRLKEAFSCFPDTYNKIFEEMKKSI